MMTRVLIAEDSSTQAAELQFILESEGFEVEVAPDGAIALERVAAGTFDVVLSDIVMPRMTGYELCRAIKANPSSRGLPVILLTTLSDPMDIIQGLECGADNFLTKPCDPDVLVARVRRIVESRRLQAEGKLKLGVEVLFLDRKFTVSSDKEQILGLLVTTFEDIVRSNRDLRKSQAELSAAKLKLEEHARRLEGQVRFSEEKYRALMDHANDAILIADERGAVLQANRQTEALLGLPGAEIMARGLRDLVIPSERAYFDLQLRKLLDEGRLHLSDVRLTKGDGQPVYTDLSMSVVPTDRGLIALVIARDMSEKIRLQRQVLHNERLATVGTLAAGVAHEINNPTAVLLGNLETVAGHAESAVAFREATLAIAAGAGGAVAEDLTRAAAAHPTPVSGTEVKEILADCTQAAERIRDIVRDLKSFAHVDQGDVALVDLHERIDATLRMAFNEIRHRARVEKRYAAEIPAIMGSPGKLNQLFVNLLVNAAQSLEGRSAKQNLISITTSREGSWIRIDVADTGSGIAPEVLPRIFDPFFTTKPIGVGTGLGLSICHEIVKAHGGDIRVRSDLGRGTTFTVTLPVDTGLAPPRSAAARPSSAAGRYRILLVDDDASLLNVYLRRLGAFHEITPAVGGRRAMEILASGKELDLILCDLMMPDVDGVDLYTHVAASAPGLQDRMIFLTGGAFTPRTKEFLATVSNPRLEKPFSMEELRRMIEEMGRARAS